MIVDVISPDEFMSFVDCHFIINMMLNFMHNQAIMCQLFELELNFVAWLVDREVRVGAMAGNIVLCLWARHFTLTVAFSTQVYKWVSANLMLGGNPVMG